jgi:hypothetical protein
MPFLSRTFFVLLCAGLLVGGLAPFALAQSAEAALPPLILRTSNGAYVDIRSGLSAATEAELLARLAGTSLPEPAQPSAPLVPTPVPPAPLDPTAPSFLNGVVAPRVIAAVRRAHALLEAGRDPVRTVKQKPSDWRLVTLALWDKDSDQIRLITVEKNGVSLRNAPSDLQIQIRGGSGYDTDYAITPSSYVVVGVRYPLWQAAVEKKVTVYTLRQMVYVPYSKSLHTQEVVDWGKVVLDRLVQDALQDIRSKNIPSKAFPGKLLADVADPVALKSIMAIEHMDHASVRSGADDRLDLFYLELGLNEQNAFHQEISSAGANGLLQFIPSTYAAVVRQWPSLNLIKDFHEGTGHLPNALKAQIAYLDGVWFDLPVQARDPYVTSPESMRAYLIAAYNTGGIRVRRAITRFGAAWDGNYRADWEKLDAKQTELAIAINRLKKKVAAEKVASKKKTLQAELATTQKKHTQVTAELEALDRSRLKAETLGYLQKYRLIAPRMKQPVQVAVLTN